ncbi:MAG: DUF2156 domain-containing protein [Nitrospirae bacterium]|nr:DUF2156 domain-containing protein [Nitrospirota bacterium]
MNNLHQLGLRPLRITDIPLIDRLLSSEETMLSAYAFVSHYLWSDLFHFYWGILDDHLCLFAQYNDYLYMPIPPILSENPFSPFEKGGLRGILRKVFSIMQAVNKNKSVSRIENIDAAQIEAFISLGYNVTSGEGEYVYLREDLATLKGDPYKSKRAMCNHFIKNYHYSYEPFQAQFADDCIQLYEVWKKRKRERASDAFSPLLSEDASLAHRQAIMQYDALQLTGRVVRINNRVEGYLFGFKRREDIFCILLEITNPDIRGLAQFIFREFCRELDGYTYINALGDSGLENLRRVKLSYRPSKIVPSYIAYLP